MKKVLSSTCISTCTLINSVTSSVRWTKLYFRSESSGKYVKDFHAEP